MSESWIKLFRKFREWEWYQDSNVKSVFLEILLTANYEDKRWQGIAVKRGQLITSVNHLLVNLNKNPKNPQISTRNIRTALKWLKSTNELTIETTPHYTLITVNKYNDYQEMTNKVTNKCQTSDKQVTTTKEIKNIRNKENIIIRKNKYSKKETITDEVMVWVANKYNVPVEMVRVSWDRVINWEPNAPRKIKDYRATLCTFVSNNKERLLVKNKNGNKFAITNIEGAGLFDS